jgi:hypothetical protein
MTLQSGPAMLGAALLDRLLELTHFAFVGVWHRGDPVNDCEDDTSDERVVR